MRPKRTLEDAILVDESGRRHIAELWEVEHWIERGVNPESGNGWTASECRRIKIGDEFYPEQAKPRGTFVVPEIGQLTIV